MSRRWMSRLGGSGSRHSSLCSSVSTDSHSCGCRAVMSCATGSCRTSSTRTNAPRSRVRERAMSDPVYPLTSKRRRLPDEGVLEVFVANEQADHPVDSAQWQLLAEQVLDAEGIRGDAELSLLFVDKAAITE